MNKLITVEKTLSRRSFIGNTIGTAGLAAAAVSPLLSSAVRAQSSGKVLPLNTPKVDHLDIIVPDVEKTTRFYMGLLNTKLHAQPFRGSNRYFVLLGEMSENRQVGYLAIGESRGRGTYIGHFCTSVFDYRRDSDAIKAEMTKQIKAAGMGDFVPGSGPGGILADPDGIEIQFLPAPDTLVTAAVPSDLVASNQGLLKPKGVDHVLLHVSDLDKAVKFYRILYGREAGREKKLNRVWFEIGDTRIGLRDAPYQYGQEQAQSPKIAHFGIKVEAFDQQVVAAKLAELGAEVLPAPEESGVLRFRDPDGITVELVAV